MGSKIARLVRDIFLAMLMFIIHGMLFNTIGINNYAINLIYTIFLLGLMVVFVKWSKIVAFSSGIIMWIIVYILKNGMNNFLITAQEVIRYGIAIALVVFVLGYALSKEFGIKIFGGNKRGHQPKIRDPFEKGHRKSSSPSYDNDDYDEDVCPICGRRLTWVPEHSVATNDFNNREEREWEYDYSDEHHPSGKWVTKKYHDRVYETVEAHYECPVHGEVY